MNESKPQHITPANVHDTLDRYVLADGLDLVANLEKSKGRRLYDERHDRWFLDMFSFFATLPIGMNHPKMRDPAFLKKLERAAINKPSNSDVYTVELAEFVETFGRLAMPKELQNLFLVSGGALGVENALKAAFDWKVRHNLRKGYKEEKGLQVLHFVHAFHGRSGYTLSLTNTADPKKYQFFARFDWPRVSSPALRFPVDAAELERVAREEANTVEQIKEAFRSRRDDIACIIIEPIQAEGGDRHFRKEFMQSLRTLADENDALLVFDEVQTGLGATGRMWAYQHHGVQPDLVAFGKKAQVCGMMAGGRIDEEPENVFKVSSRINSTWGGNLVDMVRCQRYLEIIAEEGLVEQAAKTGAYLLSELQRLQSERADVMSNARGSGLLCAVDFPDSATRDRVGQEAYELGMIILPCGTHSLRFRPPLDVTKDEVDEALVILGRAVDKALAKSA